MTSKPSRYDYRYGQGYGVEQVCKRVRRGLKGKVVEGVGYKILIFVTGVGGRIGNSL